MRSQRGQALLEFAIALPLLLALVVGLLLFGLGLHAKGVIIEAAAQGARTYAVTGNPAAARDAVIQAVEEGHIPLTFGGLTLFDPNRDVQVWLEDVDDSYGTRDAVVAITYRQPTLVRLGAALADPANPSAPWFLLQAQVRHRMEVQP
jgi:Flp pilus assembly protein TadG